MPQNGFMCKDQAGDGRIEAGSNRTGDTASDEHIRGQHAACHLSQETAHRCPEMHEWSILPN